MYFNLIKIKLIFIFISYSLLFVKGNLNDRNQEIGKMSEIQIVFANNFYKSITSNFDGNLFFSPFNIATALSMFYIGSGGNTEMEIKSALNISWEMSTLRQEYRRLLTDMKKEQSDFELKSTNKIYISKEFAVLDEFTSALTNDFLSSITLMDFADKEYARMEINRDIETETQSKIKDLIPDGFLSEMTRLVLVNAIYFKGLWLHAFKTSDTENKPFWITEHRFVDAPMMSTKNHFRFKRNDELNYTLLAMDYQGDRLTFLIILPNEISGLKNIEENLQLEDFSLTDLEKVQVEVSIPKFKMEETIDLEDTLKMLGVANLFSEDRCDLSGISGQKDLFVSKVLHKAFIDVDEAGTEAAAATVSNIRLKRSLDMPETFVADRPFLFLIYDETLNLVLFMGRFVAPSTPLKRAFTDEL